MEALEEVHKTETTPDLLERQGRNESNENNSDVSKLTETTTIRHPLSESTSEFDPTCSAASQLPDAVENSDSVPETVEDEESTFSYVYQKDTKSRHMLKSSVDNSAEKASSLDLTQLYTGDITKDLTDVGIYSYFTLVAVAMFQLYDNAQWDR